MREAFKTVEDVLVRAIAIPENPLRKDCHNLVPNLLVFHFPTKEVVEAQQVMGPQGNMPNTVLTKLPGNRFSTWESLSDFGDANETGDD